MSPIIMMEMFTFLSWVSSDFAHHFCTSTGNIWRLILTVIYHAVDMKTENGCNEDNRFSGQSVCVYTKGSC